MKKDKVKIAKKIFKELIGMTINDSLDIIVKCGLAIASLAREKSERNGDENE